MVTKSKKPTTSKHAGGRPHQLTPELQKQLIKTIREVYTVKYAATMCELAPSTLQDWLYEGRKDRAQNKDTLMAKFSVQFHKAQLEATLELVGEIRSDKDWKAKSWILERLKREDFSMAGEDVEKMVAKIDALEKSLSNMITKASNPFANQSTNSEELYNAVSKGQE